VSDFRQRIEKLSPKRLALLALELQSKLEEKERERAEPIAIIGIGCRMPGSGAGPQAFWNLLADGRDAISETPIERWDASAYYDPNPDAPGRMSTKLGAYLSNIDLFDAPFFSIARREAVSMDPQQRLLLEVCWEALENAGHSPRKLSGTATGVFLGICSTDYHDMLLARGDEAIDAYVASGVAPSIAAGRISYTLGLQGPSMSVDTACSASLVAVHLACQSLRLRESRMALAGGVNLTLTPETTIALSKAHMMAPDGRCKAFDSRADGFVRGEGCGIVVLKRLSDAVADSDNVLAVIRGSAVNQDGRSSGITAPNGAAQEALIRQALANGGVKPEEISYVEAHGTGTSLGDPIEAHALAAVLGPGRAKENLLVIGSVKTNVGHLESAAGVAGLIKLVLSLQHEKIPANLHFQKMNPHIDWGGVPVEIPVAARPWARGEKKRIAGLSSFGFSGTNAHLIVEEAPARKQRKRELELDRPLHVLALSARNETALQELVGRYVEELGKTAEELGNICYTANAGRAHFEQRMAVVGATVEEMRRKLQERKTGVEAQDRGGLRPVFLFSGQGSQYPGMGKQLFESHSVFRKAILDCEDLLKGELEKSLREVLWGDATELLEQTAYTQPALFALEYALSEVWKSWGITPGVVLGHSVGEYVAACVAGVYTLADGLKLIAARARLMQNVRGRGAMAAVMASEAQVRDALVGLETRVSIAGLNAPESVVISGCENELALAEQKLIQAGVRVQRLAVSHAFHSPQMAEMEAEFEALAATIPYAAPRVKLISSVTGKEIARGEINAGYWRRQVRQPVRFHSAMQALEQSGQRVFVEIGPGSTLVGLGRQCLEAKEETGKPERMWAVSARKSRGEWEQILESLGRLYERGAEVDWEGFDQGYGRRRVALPTYPFQRQRYWIEGPARRSAQFSKLANAQDKNEGAAQAAGAGQVPDDWYYKVVWEPKPFRSALAPAARQTESNAHAPANSSKPPHWLILPDHRGVAEKVAAQIRERGGNARILDSHESILEHLRSVSYGSVLHLSSLDSPELGSLGPEELWASQSALASSVLATTQAMVSAQSKARLWLLTSGAESVADTQAGLNMIQSPVWGLGRTIALEQPASWGGLIDLDPAADSQENAAQIVKAILQDDGEDQSAIRNGERFVARVKRRAPLAAPQPTLDAQKIYLITGGLGELGLQVAKWTVERGARRLVLAGRTGLPDRTTWENLDPKSPAGKRAAAVRQLEQLGAEVRVTATDFCDAEQAAALFASFGPGELKGVIHLAAALDGSMIKDMTRESLLSVLEPKTKGTWILHRLTEKLSLDFFVMFSSWAAVLGAHKLGHYAAANHFLDVFARYRSSLGLPALTVNWASWDQMHAGAEVKQEYERGGLRPMRSDLALSALGQALSAGVPRIVVAAVNWSVHKPLYESRGKRPILENVSDSPIEAISSHQETEAKTIRGALRGMRPDERPKRLIQYLVQALAPILGIEPASIDPIRPLNDFGMDSLMALEFRNLLASDLGVSVPTVRFLEGISLQETALQILADPSMLSNLKTSQEQSTSPSKAVATATGVALGDVFRIPTAQRQAWLAKGLVAALAPILGVEPATIDASRSLSDFGLDSLMALEFKNCIASELGVTIPTVRFLEGPNLQEVASQIVAELPTSTLAESAPILSATTLEFPLSYAQQQAYFGHKLTPDSAAFNIGFTAKASPHLDWPAFERAVAKLLNRHPSMRAVIVETDNGPMQRILPADTPMARLIDATALNENEVKDLVIQDFKENFELDQPLFRASVFRLADCDVIYFKVDHFIFDHWSVQLCVEDLKKFYTAELNGTEAELQPIKAEYQDYVEWEAEISRNDELWKYWQVQLDGDLPVLRIPCPQQRPTALLARGEAIPLAFPPSLSARIKEVARPLKTTSYTFMLTAFQVLLYRFSKQNDMIVGTSVTGREDARWTNTIGFFINVLPLRTKFSGNPTFAEYLLSTRDTVLGALKHQEFPFSEMIKRLRFVPNLERVPVFQAFFNFVTNQAGDFGRVFMGVPGGPVQLGSSALVPWLTLPVKEGRIEVGLQLGEANGEVGGYLNYNSDVLDRPTAEAMVAAYCEILEVVVRHPYTPIEDLARETEGVETEREEIAL